MTRLTDPSHYRWQETPAKVLNEHVPQQIVSGNDMMLSQLTLQKGAVVDRHSHPNEQFTCILTGALMFRLGEQLDREIVVRAGEVLHIPANVPHSAFALEDTLDLDIFSPPRADWALAGGADYFGKPYPRLL
jgi:quercetin dioxygenase-like cupin family protein